MKEFFEQQWNKLQTWVSEHGGFTKIVAAAIVVLGLAYGSVPEFHDFCVSIWAQFPTKLKTALVAGFTLYSWLRNPATRKIVDGIIGPGDTATAVNPVVAPDGTLSASSITVEKSKDAVAVPATPAVLTSPLIIPKKS